MRDDQLNFCYLQCVGMQYVFKYVIFYITSLLFLGTPCKILTYDQSTLEGTFSEWNPNGTEMLVTDLKTPTNMKMDIAVLRTPDIIAVHFENKKT